MGISLDPQHLSFAVDRATTKRRQRSTRAGLAMRIIMAKFDIPVRSLAETRMYQGGTVSAYTPAEEDYRANIEKGNMPLHEAIHIMKTMSPNTPFRTFSSFARVLAAFVRVYPQYMDSTSGKGTLRRSILHAATHQQYQWLLNNTRYRSCLPASEERALASGTTRNEAMHHRVNAHFHETTQVTERMLVAELGAWLLGDMAVSVRILSGPLSRKMSRADMLPLATSSIDIFDEDAWGRYVAQPCGEWKYTTLGTVMKRPSRKCFSSLQVDIYEAMRAKQVKRRRVSLFGV